MTVSKKYKNSNITTLRKLFQPSLESEPERESGTRPHSYAVGELATLTSQGRESNTGAVGRAIHEPRARIVENTNAPRGRGKSGIRANKKDHVKLIDTSKLLTQ